MANDTGMKILREQRREGHWDKKDLVLYFTLRSALQACLAYFPRG